MADDLDSDAVIVDAIEDVVGELLEVESSQSRGSVDVKPFWASLDFFKGNLEFRPKIVFQSLRNVRVVF